jgi:NAD(P)-dependent dehydrogenase (short-subunit alcohol dehydrogenase family)
MRITQVQRRTLAVGALALGAVMARSVAARRSYDFGGKSVLVTGGSRGLGLVLARQLAREGARLTLIARDAQELARAADDIRSTYPSAEVLTIQTDVRQKEEVDRAVAQLIDRYQRVDVVVNNAGIIQVGPLDHMGPSDYEDAMRTHFWGPLYTTLAVLPHMRRQRSGRIVNISSIGGKVSVPHMLPYCSSKFALVGLSDGLRAELARENILVTTVCPGLMRTGSAVNAMFKGMRGQEYAWFALSASLPVVSTSAERAAGQILNACRRGDAELIFTPSARLAALVRALTPELVAHAMSIMNRLLPSPVGAEGDPARPGRVSKPAGLPTVLLAPMYGAARRNNEL